MLAHISGMISRLGFNIENLLNRSQGEFAYTLVDVDTPAVEGIAVRCVSSLRSCACAF